MIEVARRQSLLTAVNFRKMHEGIPRPNPCLEDNIHERNVIRVQLAHNVLLKGMTAAQMAELEPLLVVVDCQKGEVLLHQGVHEMEQYFILDGILKRVVRNQEAKEMILRFAARARWRRATPPGAWARPRPTCIVCVTKAPRREAAPARWWSLHRAPPGLKQTLRVRGDAPHERDHGAHHHAAPARCAGPREALPAQAPELESAAEEGLASYLNLSAETLQPGCKVAAGKAF
jgi:CRP-like cAMP-binding protein